jgi:hypothetical protein
MAHKILDENPQYAAFAKRRREASAAFDKAVADQQGRLAVYNEACNQAATNGTAYPPAPESEQSIRSRFAVQSHAIDEAETAWLQANAANLEAECYAREDELMAEAAARREEFVGLRNELRSLGTALQTLAFKAGTARPEVTAGLRTVDVLNAARVGGRVLRPTVPAGPPAAEPRSLLSKSIFQRTGA